MNTAEKWHGTTIVLLRKNGETVVAGDGQVSLGNTVLKSKARKVRKIESRGKRVPASVAVFSITLTLFCGT